MGRPSWTRLEQGKTRDFTLFFYLPTFNKRGAEKPSRRSSNDSGLCLPYLLILEVGKTEHARAMKDEIACSRAACSETLPWCCRATRILRNEVVWLVRSGNCVQGVVRALERNLVAVCIDVGNDYWTWGTTDERFETRSGTPGSVCHTGKLVLLYS